MAALRKVDWIVVHCSATRAIQDIGANEITRWHKAKGWSDIGYHFVIRLNGALELGRSTSLQGAHVKGHNHNSIGICLVGGLENEAPWKPAMTYTPKQMAKLEMVIRDLLKLYPNAKVRGHRDFKGVAKACPCFDARAWAKKKGLPAA